MFSRGCKEKKMNLERKFLSVEDPIVHSLLFAHSFEIKVGTDFDLASYLKTKPESAVRKHPNLL